MSNYIAAIDQGTTSTRCIIFDHSGMYIGKAQKEHKQIYPCAGWVEHDPIEILSCTKNVIKMAITKANISPSDLVAVGITNQRETIVIWDKNSGSPLYNAIVWMDTRNSKLVANAIKNYGDKNVFQSETGLPFSTYFSLLKIKWLVENVKEVQDAIKAETAMIGTIDTWLIWNLTGGIKEGKYVTDVTNASRTMLMNIRTLKWDSRICDDFQIPISILPHICSSSEIYGYTTEDGPFKAKIPISGNLGDQQASMVGHACLNRGEVKNTYGTGCFMLLNTGTDIKYSKTGLLTTVCYKFGNKPVVYAIEGSVTIAGALVQWLRDNLGIINNTSEIENLARTVSDNGDIYFVPAFSGLYAPYWRDDARGVIVGMTLHTSRGHIARAALEATAYQTRDILEAMNVDTDINIVSLKVDGGMVKNEFLMQFQSDLLGLPIIRSKIQETTALGAAYAAGLAVNYWNNEESICKNWCKDREWTPSQDSKTGTKLYNRWKKAVERSFDWVE